MHFSDADSDRVRRRRFFERYVGRGLSQWFYFVLDPGYEASGITSAERTSIRQRTFTICTAGTTPSAKGILIRWSYSGKG